MSWSNTGERGWSYRGETPMPSEKDLTLEALLHERENLRAALRKLLLSRDASWTGGHDWTEAVDDAVRALGIEGNHDRT